MHLQVSLHFPFIRQQHTSYINVRPSFLALSDIDSGITRTSKCSPLAPGLNF